MRRRPLESTASKDFSRRTVLAGAAAGAVALSAGPALAAGQRRAAPLAAAAAGFAVPIDSVAHTRTWMAWPDSTQIWGRQLAGVQQNIATIAQTIAQFEPVYLCANAASVATARSKCGSAVTVLGTIPVNDCWMRDTGPIFLTDGQGGLQAVGLNFNGWGGKQVHNHDALVAQNVAAYVGVPFTKAAFTSEGGAIETDGAGTLMATESSIVNSNRNPGATQAQLTADMCAAYGASKVIWFAGIKGQDITDDHVDATSRFLGPGLGAVQVPDPSETDIWAKDELNQYAVLSASTDAEGQPIAVTKIAGPDYNLIRSQNLDFVGAYANYYVCNGAVISAQFGDSATDAEAKATLQSLFPGREVVQLNIDNLGNGGGGIHCVTQQQPAV